MGQPGGEALLNVAFGCIIWILDDTWMISDDPPSYKPLINRKACREQWISKVVTKIYMMLMKPTLTTGVSACMLC